MSAVRAPAPRPDRRSLLAFERTTAALARSAGRRRAPTPLGDELRSSALLLLAVLGLPLLVIVLVAG